MRGNDERERAEARARLAAIVESSNEAIFSKTPDGIVDSWNVGAEHVYGYAADDVVGRPAALLAPEDRKHEVPELIRRTLRGEDVHDFETVRVRKDGRQIHVSLRLSPIRASDGTVVGISTISRDVTVRKEAERYARSLLEASLDPLVTISPAGKITDVNEATIKATGVSREKLVGTDFADYFTEPEKAREGYREVFARGFVTDYPLTIRREDRRLTDVLYNASVYKDTQGNVLGVFAAARDVTERKRAEESSQKLLRAVEQAENAIFMSGPDGVITYVNPAFAKIYGYSKTEALGQTPRILKSGRYGPAFYERFWKRLLAGESVRHELVNRRRDGQLVTVEQTVNPVVDTAGKRVGFIAVQNDITERKRAEEQIHRLNADLEQRVVERTAELEAVNKELESFAYSVSHDLRAPLRSIDGFTRILEEDYGDRLDAEGKQVTSRIVEAARSMGHLIDDLLKLSRVTRAELRRQTVDLSEIAREVAKALAQREPDRKVEVVIGQAAVVEGDPQLLRLAMENLIGNAFKFTSRRTGARIEFGREDAGGEPVYYVRDNGAGFDQAYAAKLFGAFQRLHADRDFPGTGVGLATVQRILRRHGGRIWGEGKTDEGATFHFTVGKEPS